jgi:hypothetical protein
MGQRHMTDPKERSPDPDRQAKTRKT